MLLSYIRRDIHGLYTIVFLRTAVALLLASLAYKSINFSGAGSYAIIMALFTSQLGLGATFSRRMITNILCIIGILVIIAITSLIHITGLYFIQVILLAILSAFTVYAFSINKEYGLILLYLTLFNIISFGLAQDTYSSIASSLYACFTGGICSLLALLIIPFAYIKWKKFLIKTLNHVLSDFCYYQTKIGFFRDFSDISLKEKNKLLDYHFSMIQLLERIHANVNDIFSHQGNDVVNSLILLSFLPRNAVPEKVLPFAEEKIKYTFSLLGDLFQQHANTTEIASLLQMLAHDIASVPAESLPTILSEQIQYLINKSLTLHQLSEALK